MEGLLLLSLLIVFAGAAIAPSFHRLFPKISPWFLSLFALIPFLFYFSYSHLISSGGSVYENYAWVGALGFSFGFHLDGLGLLFALLISGIGTFIVLYGGTYLSKDKNLPKFYSYLFIFMGAMLGVVISDNIFSLFVFWELTSISSYLLIGYKHGYEDSRKSALQALMVTGSGGLALMAGLILLSASAGSPNISEWTADSSVLSGSPHYMIMLVLLLLGAFTKSAQFPFHFWLPNAMAAPTPVSAYLHSATMVKAGVYLLARLNPYFEGSPEWQFALTTFGGITMVFGVIWALFQSDLKKILAYTTVSALGLMVFFIGIGTQKAVQAAMVFLLAHALYKGGLFMIAGNVDHSTGTREISKLFGLFPKMKFTGTAAVLTALSLAGFPLVLGFLAKELLYEAAMNAPGLPFIYTAAIFITGVISAYLAILLGWRVFFSKQQAVPEGAHEVRPGMFAGPLVLGLAGLITGMIPGISAQGLLSEAAVSVSPAATGMKLYLWHGFNAVLLLSIITLISGWLLYKFSGIFSRTDNWVRKLEKAGPEAIYNKSWGWLLYFTDFVSRTVQSGYLRFYIMTIVLALAAALIAPVFYYRLVEFNLSFAGVELYEILLLVLVAVSILLVVRATSRLAAIAILGVVGYGIAIFFAIYGAPDLAMTQFLIETLTVVVFMFILYRLPGYMKLSPGLHRQRDIIIALTGGATITAVMLLVTDYPLSSELKQFFAENSYVLAKGRNVVNVILVDFRALDTFGEITVLAIAAMGVYAMMKLRLSGREK